MASLVTGLGGLAGFGENQLSRNDDSYLSNIDVTQVFGAGGLNFFGTTYTAISINNNGNITFGTGGMSTFTPFGLQNGGKPIIAPFFADVDTRGGTSSTLGPNVVTPTAGGTSQGSNLVYYDFNPSGSGTLTVTWDDVGYYASATDKLNAFQMQLVGKGGGNFDVIFRYESINWTTGGASGGVGGLGGVVARAGYSTGDGASWYELAQSGIQDQMLSLETAPGNTGVAGYYKFSVFSGTAAPETINGTSHDDILSGLGGNDVLNGLAGNDTLDGSGGADTMKGGAGNDRYVVDVLGDKVVELANNGIDLVQSAITFKLGSNVENLQLTGTANINGTGNGLNNVLSGNSGSNTLNGGLGSDTVSYATQSWGISLDLTITTAQWLDGYDTLVSIENVMGTISNDTLKGTAAANILDGNLGADTLIGAAGNDTYFVDVAANVANFIAGDTITELAGQGKDTVMSSATWALGANLENLTLIGSGAINGTGNSLNNILVGNAAANSLKGAGGNDVLAGGGGKDKLTGGAGADTFDFNLVTDSKASNSRDVITDFLRGTDRIDLSDIDAIGGTAGVNDAFSFITGTSFTAAGQLRFANGILYGSTDADTAAEFQIALTGITAMAASDFVL